MPVPIEYKVLKAAIAGVPDSTSSPPYPRVISVKYKVQRSYVVNRSGVLFVASSRDWDNKVSLDSFLRRLRRTPVGGVLML